MEIFDKTSLFLKKVLDMRVTRHSLITSNIANQETPGYKALDLDFEGVFKKAITAKKNGLVLVGTDKRHLPSPNGFLSSQGVKIVQRSQKWSGYDKNSVKVDEEMAKLAENTLLYNATIKALSSKAKRLAKAIQRSGG